MSKDFNDRMKSVAPLVFEFVLLLAFTLMLAAFRSLVIAAKAIVLNLLSIDAAYGVMALVFQHGVGKGVLGFESTAGIDSFLPIFLFVILFGLSMRRGSTGSPISSTAARAKGEGAASADTFGMTDRWLAQGATPVGAVAVACHSLTASRCPK